MALLLARGVESAKAELAVMKKALGLIGAAGFADDGESLQRDDGELVLQLAARLALKGKGVEQAFSGLPEDGWTWSVVRENLSLLCEAANKSLPWRRLSCTPRFTRSCGAPHDAAQSCRFYVVRACLALIGRVEFGQLALRDLEIARHTNLPEAPAERVDSL